MLDINRLNLRHKHWIVIFSVLPVGEAAQDLLQSAGFIPFDALWKNIRHIKFVLLYGKPPLRKEER